MQRANSFFGWITGFRHFRTMKIKHVTKLTLTRSKEEHHQHSLGVGRNVEGINRETEAGSQLKHKWLLKQMKFKDKVEVCQTIRKAEIVV